MRRLASVLSLLMFIPFLVFAQSAGQGIVHNTTSNIQSIDQTLSNTDLQKLVQDLLKQLRALQQQVAALQGELGQGRTTSTTPVPDVHAIALEAIPPELTRFLSRGSSGDDVRKLQEFLAKDKNIYPDGLVTGYFGPLTEAAVKRWQEKHNIESVGIVGPKTIAKFHELGGGRVQELIHEGAGQSGVVPPGLLTAPGLQMRITTSTSPAATSTPPASINPTSTPSIPATPAIPISDSGSSTVPAIPASPSSGGGYSPPVVATTIIVTSPNGGEQWLKGNTYPITWTSTGNIPKVTIELRYGDVKVDAFLVEALSNVGSWNWTLPANQTWLGSGYYIRVSNSADYNIRDDGNTFSIAAPISTATTTSTATSATSESDSSQPTSTASTASTTIPSADTTAPSTPAGVYAEVVPSSIPQVNFYWNVSTDNVGVTGYKVYRNGTLVDLQWGVASWTLPIKYVGPDYAVAAGTTYGYTVAAYDAAGNVSAQSSPVSITTPSSATTNTTSSGLMYQKNSLASVFAALSEILSALQWLLR